MVHLKKNYKLSQEFIRKLFEQTAGYIEPGTFDRVVQLFESELSDRFFSFSSESNLLRIIMGMYDKATFLNECLRYPHYIEILSAIAFSSNYLTDILVRNPEYFYWIVNPSTLEEKISYEKLSDNVRESLSSFRSFQAKINSLRTFKRKEMLRTGVKDILRKSSLKEITKELSDLANVITAGLFSICYSEVLQKYSLKDPDRKYCLISLGKLGGGELNYSSDIDLIIFFDEDELLPNKKLYSEILNEVIYLFIESSSSLSSTGYIYRVDFRLRPDGRNSPLCRSLPEYLNYYESRGEDWERQMLIKMNFCTGSDTLYESFESYIKSFVYPLSFVTPPIEQIKKLKANIEKNLSDEENIKLIPGGIRDIEFSVQALQLLNGGRNNFVRTSNTLVAIERLSASGFLSKEESTLLNGSYIFYRRIEHFLQLMNDSQTHTIPTEGETLEKLSAFLSFKNSTEFRHAVFENRRAVLKLYDSIMGINASSSKKLSTTADINFRNKTKAGTNLQFLRDGKGLLGQRQFDKSCRDNFIMIEPALLEYLRTSVNPDQVLQNFARVIRNSSLPSVWYKEFKDKKLFYAFLKLAEFSQLSVDLFAEDHDLREYFLTKKAFEKLNKKSIQSLNLKEILFVTAVQFTLDLIDSQNVSVLLKNFFFHSISKTAEKALPDKIKKAGFMIAALGSLGSGEVTFKSDIDLIFGINNINMLPDVQKYFQKLLTKLKDELKPFDVDCRLRPEGKSSNITWDTESYCNYILSRARIWELQAFTKVNFITGEKRIFNLLNKAIRNRIAVTDPKNLQKEIREMRIKLYPKISSSSIQSFNLKRSKGGLTDIEFLVQYFLLSDKKLFSIFKGKRIEPVISKLSCEKEFSNLNKLKENFIFLKEFELNNQNIFNSSSGSIPLIEERLTPVSIKMGFKSAEQLKNKLSEIIKLNQAIFAKYLEE